MSDRILISRLFLETVVGVPEAERSAPQRVAVSIEIRIDTRPAAASDSLRRTVDYEAVANALKAAASSHPRHLIETLAEDLAQTVLKFEGAAAVVLTLEKFILPDAESVAVRIERSRG